MNKKNDVRLKVLLYVNSFLPNIGGKEIVVYNLAKELTKLGHNVRVVGPGGALKKRNTWFPFPVHRCPSLNGKFEHQINFIYLLFNILTFGCDILHAHNTYPNGYIAAKLKKILKYPLVITPHGSDIHTIPRIKYGHLLNKAKMGYVKYAINQSDILTAISTSVRKSLLVNGAHDKKIFLIPNGIEAEKFVTVNKLNLKSKFNLPDNAKIILTVGNYRRCKGHEEILYAMPKILQEIPEAYCLIIGANNEVLSSIAKEKKMENHVILYGKVDYIVDSQNNHTLNKNENLLTRIYQSSDLYVSAGIDEGAEGLSLSLLDAMASNLPIVGTNISGNKDILENGKSGVLIPPSNVNELANGIIYALRNYDKAQNIAAYGNKVARSYQWDKIAQSYIDIYRVAIKKNSSLFK